MLEIDLSYMLWMRRTTTAVPTASPAPSVPRIGAAARGQQADQPSGQTNRPPHPVASAADGG